MSERRKVPREPDRRTGWERRQGPPPTLPRCAIEWAKDQVVNEGRTITQVAKQLGMHRTRLGRRISDLDRVLIHELSLSALRWRCQECSALSLSPKCPNGHVINDRVA